MDEDHIEHRNFDRKSLKFQSKEPGRIIKSLRKFGLEFEMYNENMKNLVALSKNISRAFGLEHDGSIEAKGYTLEVVSPIMSGAVGERSVFELLEQVNNLGFKVNKSCGMHVHLDGEGFSNDGSSLVTRVSDVSKDTFANVGRGDIAFVVRADVMSEFVRATHLEPDDVAELIAEELVAGQRQIFLSKTVGVSVPELKVKDTTLTFDKQDVLMEMVEDIKAIKSKVQIDPEGDSYEVVPQNPSKPNPEDFLCIVHYSRNLQNLKTLIYLHTVYADVFKAMLPESRRSSNGFCQDVSLGFSAKQIEAISSYAELEAAWYTEKSSLAVKNRKRDKYDDSRYYSMNLHSLFAKYGTVEIRSHSGTTDPLKALYWTALHSEIMDKIVKGEVTMDGLRLGATLFSVEEKLPVFLDVLNLRTALRKYVIQRIEYFNKK